MTQTNRGSDPNKIIWTQSSGAGGGGANELGFGPGNRTKCESSLIQRLKVVRLNNDEQKAGEPRAASAGGPPTLTQVGRQWPAGLIPANK